MCDNSAHSIQFVPDRYKTQNMCNKAGVTYSSLIQFIPDQDKFSKMCDKAVNTCPFVFDSVPDQYVSLKKCVIKLFPKKLLC